MDPPYAEPPSSASVSQVKIAAIHLASMFVVELVHEVGGQIVAAGALVAFQDHGSRPMARKQTVRISARSRNAAAM